MSEEVRSVLLGEALTLGQVTHTVLGAAVQVVGAADGLGEGRVFRISVSLVQGAARLTAGTTPSLPLGGGMSPEQLGSQLPMAAPTLGVTAGQVGGGQVR